MKWIEVIQGLFKKNKTADLSSQVRKNVEIDWGSDLPRFLFQEDYYSIAWGRNHGGYYIDLEGKKYSYKQPLNWNFYETQKKDGKMERSWGIEKIAFIEKNLLLENLSFCEISFTEQKIEAHEIDSLIDELIQADLVDTGFGGCDMGLQSKALLVFDNINNTYKRILLSCEGDKFAILNSPKTTLILQLFIQPNNSSEN
jgi:hypothetical protein